MDAPPSNWSTGFLSAFWRARFYLAHDVPRAYIHSLRTDADRTYVQSDHKLFAIHIISAIFFCQVMLATWVVPFLLCYPLSSCVIIAHSYICQYSTCHFHGSKRSVFLQWSFMICHDYVAPPPLPLLRHFRVSPCCIIYILHFYFMNENSKIHSLYNNF